MNIRLSLTSTVIRICLTHCLKTRISDQFPPFPLIHNIYGVDTHRSHVFLLLMPHFFKLILLLSLLQSQISCMKFPHICLATLIPFCFLVFGVFFSLPLTIYLTPERSALAPSLLQFINDKYISVRPS